MSDDEESGRRAYYDSAYGDLGDGSEDDDEEESARLGDPEARDPEAVDPEAFDSEAHPGEAPVDADTEGPVVSARSDRSALARRLDRVAEALATLGVYIAVVSTLLVPVGLVAVGVGVQPAGNYLITGALGGWLVAMALALVAGMRESDPYDDAKEKRELERSFF